MRRAIVACRSTSTNSRLTAGRLGGAGWELMDPEVALEQLTPDDVALGRLDVRPTLDGIDDGLWAFGVLSARGVTVLNGAAALLATHDKLLTARLLRRAGLPHPLTYHVRSGRTHPIEPPVVVKPRFGERRSRCRSVRGRCLLPIGHRRNPRQALVSRTRCARPGTHPPAGLRPAPRCRCGAGGGRGPSDCGP